MNITITQDNSRVELLGSNGAAIISKLYLLAIDPNNTLTLRGNVSSTSAYGYLMDYLNTNYGPDLTVNATNRYIKFEDPEFLRCAIAKYSTDGVGVTLAELDAVTDIGNPSTSGTFANSITNNTTLTSMIDLLKFRNLTTLQQGLGFGNTNVTEVGIPSSITSIALGNYKFLKDSSILKIYILSIGNFTRINYPSFWGERIFSSQPNSDLYILDSNGNSEKLQVIDVSNQMLNNFDHKMTLSNCKTINQVNFEYGITNAMGSMFTKCLNVTTVNIPTTLIKIGGYFKDCSNLITVNLVNGNNVSLFDLNQLLEFDDVFYGCTKLNLGVLYCPSWTIPKKYEASLITNLEGISYYDGPKLPFGGCTFDHLYLPNLIRTVPNTLYRNYFTCSSFLGSGGNAPDTQYLVLYFKNIQNFYIGEFNRIKASAIVINNVTPPEFKNYNDLSDSYITTNNTAWEFTKDTNFDRWDTTNKIYVPDSAVNDYKTAPIWSKVASYIYPISDLQQYATKADWETAGKPVGLIQAYMS